MGAGGSAQKYVTGGYGDTGFTDYNKRSAGRVVCTLILCSYCTIWPW